MGVAALTIAVLGAVALWRLGGSDQGTSAVEPGPVHVHGLGINPADGALFISTHTGLYRTGPGESKASRVGDSRQDTMGFTVVGANRFLGSGHPDLRQDLPPLLGLIESTDEGRSWEPVSLVGEADFHVLRYAGDRVYGYDSSNDRLLASVDAGRTWDQIERPVPLVDLAADPDDSVHVLATGASDFDQGLYESTDGGRSWKRIGDQVGLLAWADRERLFLVDGAGSVFMSGDHARTFRHRGAIGGEPAALLGRRGGELYAALHDGTIKRSGDGGRTWSVRSMP